MELSTICRAALSVGASDIHIKARQQPFFRVDGELRKAVGAPTLSKEQVAKMAWQVMRPDQRERFKSDPDLDTSFQTSEARFRANIYRSRGSIGMVLRAIPGTVQAIDPLGLPPVLKHLASQQNGLILLTGATGSGKSTTLAALVEEVNRTRHCHILTIEDPIEFTFQSKRATITQREVGQDSVSFASALRAALRQDPDVILLGELRDRETMEIAISAAETGHLVMGTLHTTNATEAIDRVVGFFAPHHQLQVRRVLSGVLVGVVSQRLIPKVGGGRVAAVEIMRNVGAASECIASPERLKELGDLIVKGTGQYGSQSFDQAIYWAYKAGQIRLEDALLYAHNPDDLQMRLSGIASDEWVQPDLASIEAGG